MGLQETQNYYSNLFSTIRHPIQSIGRLFGSNTPAVPQTNAPNQSMAAPNQQSPSFSNASSPATPSIAPLAAPSGGGGSHTVASGDTLSAIASKNNISLQQLIDLNPQYRANPNLIKPGEMVSLGGGTSTAPQAPSPVAPTALISPAAPVAPAAPTINPATGGMTSPTPPAVTAATVPPPAPAAVPDVSGFTSPEYESAASSVEQNLQLSPEEIANQEKINALNASMTAGITGEADRPIPLDFITGRQASIERRGLALQQPLSAKAALLQAKRIASLDASKFKLGLEADKLTAERESKKPISGSSFYDPTTGEFKTAQAKGTEEPFTLGKDQARYDASGNLIAANGAGGKSEQASNDASYWSGLIKSGGAKLSEVPSDIRTDVVKQMAKLGGLKKGSQDAISQAGVVMEYIDRISPMVNGLTTGISGMAMSKVPGTDAYDLGRLIDTVKANVGFSALQAMRNASPTGGALGQVSEMENRLLQATLGSLDQGQSKEQLNKNLEEIKLHFNNLIDILNQEALPEGANASGGGGYAEEW